MNPDLEGEECTPMQATTNEIRIPN